MFVPLSSLVCLSFSLLPFFYSFSLLVLTLLVFLPPPPPLHSGPYWCAQDDVEVALHACMVDPDVIDVQELIAATLEAAEVLSIDE